MSEQRAAQREFATLICRFDVGDESHDGMIVNISQTGVGIQCFVPLAKGAFKDLLFVPTSMKIPAKVVWCRKHMGSFRIGFAFRDEAPEIIDIVRQLEQVWKRHREQ